MFDLFLMKYTYLWINFFTVLIPFIFSFHPKLKFYKEFGSFIKANLLVASGFIAWDIAFTKIGVWGFNPNYISGYQLYNLPIEEVLFFICIPFSSVFTYHSLTLFYNFKWRSKIENLFILSTIGFLFAIGIYFNTKWYTSTTFLTTGLLLFFLKFVKKATWLPKFFSVYAVLLIPFFIVNGILTGTGLSQPIVWYNDAENLGFRILTIPIEDFFYGFEMLLLNVFLYTCFVKNKQKLRFKKSKNYV